MSYIRTAEHRRKVKEQKHPVKQPNSTQRAYLDAVHRGDHVAREKALARMLAVPRAGRMPDLLTAAQREEEMREAGSRRFVRDDGFTLIELLVVILIVGILTAISIPTFLSQVVKAKDVAAKELVHTAEVVAVAYADEHGTYEGLTPAYLHEQEPTVEVVPSASRPYVSEAHGGTTGYSVVAVAAGGDTYTYALGESNGVVERVCTPAGVGGCSAAGTW
jgi:prepilin-type N-terminal cleavage/methylation domain-containing protein